MEQEEDLCRYQVLINDEEQYSLWLESKVAPLGWRSVGFAGSRQDCMDYVDEHWRDMRPLTLRHAMEESAV